MHLSAVQHAGPLLDLTNSAKRMGVATLSYASETNDAFQQSLTAVSSESGTQVDDPLTTAGTVGSTRQAAPNSALPGQQSTLREAATQSPTNTDAGSLLSTLKSYTSATQDSAQAYQEYAKAWGGRVVHGQVELPPLSIYLE